MRPWPAVLLSFLVATAGCLTSTQGGDGTDAAVHGADTGSDAEGDAAPDGTVGPSGGEGPDASPMTDTDGDGADDGEDNCPDQANADQADMDGDGIGDACDDDRDGDGLEDTEDRCPETADADNTDLDGDGAADPCDSDDDGDGVEDDVDNCPRHPNTAQVDTDGDGAGDPCDSDDDGDGVGDDADSCPQDPDPAQTDGDGDGVGDACDSDDDNDGTPDVQDNCPRDANAGQADSDDDGVGDACDLTDDAAGDTGPTDSDGDGIEDGMDNCPAHANADQADTDGDGTGDPCDPNDDRPDADGDGIKDAEDSCPQTPDLGRDGDGDGVDDACDRRDHGAPDEGQIRPGVRITSSQGSCTTNFLFWQDYQTYFIGTAAHCFGTGDSTETNGCEAGTLAPGAKATIENADHEGVLVYSSWYAMRSDGESDADACAYNDFALVKVHQDDLDKVHPAAVGYGGPTHVVRSADQGDAVYTYGRSSLHLGSGSLEKRSGTITSAGNSGDWYYRIRTDTPGVPGDSGSAVLHESGGGLGILVTIGVDGANGVTALDTALAYANSFLDRSVETETWDDFSP